MIKEFGRRSGSVQFSVYGVVYHAYPELPDEAFHLVVGMQETTDKLTLLDKIFSIVLLPESAQKFIEASTAENNIGLMLKIEIFEWLMGQYSDRPLGSSSES
jgi:hypothetical protein